MFLSIGMLKQKYFLADIFILSAEKQPIKLSWRKIECLLLLSRVKKLSRTDCLVISFVWILLTVLFEFGMGLATGSSVCELLKAYNPSSGNLWLLVVVATGAAPFLALKSRNK